MKCATCDHWNRRELNGDGVAPEQGECRRFPPTAMAFPVANALKQVNMQIIAAWPVTLGELVCGEWEGPDVIEGEQPNLTQG